MSFTTDDTHLIKWMWVKNNYVEKNACSRCVWQKMKSWWGKDWSKYQCKIFNCVDLCNGVSIVWSTTTRTRVRDATELCKKTNVDVLIQLDCTQRIQTSAKASNLNQKWCGIGIRISGLIWIRIWIAPKFPKCCELSSVISPSVVKLASDCMRNANK